MMATSHAAIDELRWRKPPALEDGRGSAATIVLSRWSDPELRTREATAEARDTHYTVALALRRTKLTLSTAATTIHDGAVAPGMLQVSEPGRVLRGRFHAPSEFLHLHVKTEALREYYEEARGVPFDGSVALRGPSLVYDSQIEHLGRAMLCAGEQVDFGTLYADGLGLALIARLLAVHANSRFPDAQSGVAGLVKWRLARVTDYIEANLSDRISLANLAAAAGLSRMHFAAQFRATTALRPHEYVLRRRIERAQDLLSGSRLPLVEVALSMGFQSQAHFSTVFKRFTGETPNRWRQLHDVKGGERLDKVAA